MDEAGNRGAGTLIADVLLALIAGGAVTAVALDRLTPPAGAGVAAAVAVLFLWRVSAARRGGRRAEESARQVGRVFEASGAVLSSLDVNHVLRAGAEVGGRLSRHSGAALLFIIDETRRPQVRASWGIEPPPGPETRFAALDPHLAEVTRTRRTLVARIERDGGNGPLGRGGFRSACLLPLQSKAGGLVGVLALASQKSAQAYQGELVTLEYFASQTAMAIDNARLYQQVQDLFLSTIKALAAAVDAKDAYTHGHSEDIAELVSMIARELRLPPREEEKVRLAGLLHDVGKIGIPDAILRKPGKLDASERAIMMTHVTVGAEIIDRPGPLRDLVGIVRHHHERFDGRGYPDGLRGDAIPIGASILSVADAFDAMTSHRAYHRAREVDAAAEELRKNAGTQFHPQVVDALLRILEREQRSNSAWWQTLERRIRDGVGGQTSVVAEQALAADEIERAWRLGQEVRDLDDPSRLAARVVQWTGEALGTSNVAVLLLDGDGQSLRVLATTGDQPADGATIPHGRSLPWQALEQRATRSQSDGTLICAPLLSAGRALGVLQAAGSGLGERGVQLLARVAEVSAPLLHTTLLRATSARSTTVDEVTGLMNRRALLDRLTHEVHRHERYGNPFALALADIQDLGGFNAAHGYGAGDELMRRVAELIAPEIRRTDSLGRMEGGTFGVLMPELDRAQAAAAVERLQESLAERDVVVRGQFVQVPALTWAVVSAPDDGRGVDALLTQAERRLVLARAKASH